MEFRIDSVHKCTNCGEEYSSAELIKLRSCKKCQGTSFMFRGKKINNDEKIEHKEVIFDFDSEADIKVIDDGIFTINISSLANHELVVIEGEEGVFFVKFPKKK